MSRRYVLGLLLVLAGCSATTETGYEPRKLGDSTTVRSGYYAAPFSPEAKAAQGEAGASPAGSRRPTMTGAR